MKPNFAAVFSATGLRLLLRVSGGWHHVGQVDFIDPALPDRMAKLREDAETLCGGRITSKIVVPNDHIRYILLPPLNGPRSQQMQTVEKALEGSTPYPLSDLAYDWSTSNDRAYVAAVARDTLREAEEFALSHGLAPVSYVATPEAGRFENHDGGVEPFFGTALGATDLLRSGEIVEPDVLPIKVTGTAEVPRFVGGISEDSENIFADDIEPADVALKAEPLPTFKIPTAATAALTTLEDEEDGLVAPPRLAGAPDGTNVVALPSDASTLERAMAIAPVTGQRRTGLDGLDDAIASLTNREPLDPTPAPAPVVPEPEPDAPDPLQELKAYRDPDPNPQPDDLRRPRKGGQWSMALILTLLLLLGLLALAFLVAPANAAERDLAIGSSSESSTATRPLAEAQPAQEPPARALLVNFVLPNDPGIRPRLRPGTPAPAGLALPAVTPVNLSLNAPLTIATVTDAALKRRPALRPGSEIVAVATTEPAADPAADPSAETALTAQPDPVVAALEDVLDDTLVAAVFAPDPRVVGKRPQLRRMAAVTTGPNAAAVDEALAIALASAKRPVLRPTRLIVKPKPALATAQPRKTTPQATLLTVALPASAAQRPTLRGGRSAQSSAPATTTVFRAPRRSAQPDGRISNVTARNATETNALKLTRVTLLGTMGTSNKKSALVRLNSGRVRSVSVGDRLDGGRVAAIDASTLRYTKGGRTITLKMPKG